MHNPREIVEALVSAASVVGGRTKFHQDIIECLAQEHRTNQQNVTRLMLLWLRKLGEMHKEKCYDTRNEASCLLGKNINDAEDIGGEFILPFI